MSQQFKFESKIELLCMLRHLRAEREKLWASKLLLEEQLRTQKPDQITEAAYRAVDADLAILDPVIKRLWTATAAWVRE